MHGKHAARAASSWANEVIATHWELAGGLDTCCHAARIDPNPNIATGIGQGECKANCSRYAVVPAAPGTCALPGTRVRPAGAAQCLLLSPAASGRSCCAWCEVLPADWLLSVRTCSLQIRLINEAAFARFTVR